MEEKKSKKLHRSDKHKIIAGVCGGIADTYDLDPTLVRLIAILFAIFTWFGPMAIGYILAWIIMPEEGATT
ncbi:MAG: PspC domain-containing protein [Candidatus Pacebacteria bacterium]|nr:PspC domain-containing protein [Candidatus Paceibacterota bacterium]